jgi:RNA polymerase sigma factor (sigma-70 family)
MDQQASVSLEELLTHAAWARRLARGLVSDDSLADDTVQDAFLTAVQKPPVGTDLRGWLRKVLTHRRINRVLSEQRREARERRVAAPELVEPPPSPEELVATIEVQRLLAGFVLELAEPFRQTLVLRYYQDLSAAEIARTLEVPAGTVRWRLKEGLGRLRARLDQERGGAHAWRAALAPIAAPIPIAPPRPRWPLPVPVLVLGAGAVAGGALLLWGWLPAGGRLEVAVAAGPGAATSPASGLNRAPPLPGDPRVPTMKSEELQRFAAFLSVGLPAMVASATQPATSHPEEEIDVCVMAQEKSAECKEPLVDSWLPCANRLPSTGTRSAGGCSRRSRPVRPDPWRRAGTFAPRQPGARRRLPRSVSASGARIARHARPVWPG